MSNLYEELICPKCKKPLKIYHDRNNMRLFVRCDNDNCELHFREYDLESTDLKLLFYSDYYRRSNNIENKI